MATVYFFEKPGCLNNTRQKQILTSAGHQVVALNLLTEPWRPARLRLFFGKQPISDWFNNSAPAVKQGQVKPEQLSEAEALALMIADPILIRRPLLQVGNRVQAGFDQQLIDEWIGLVKGDLKRDLESCSKPSAGTCQLPS